MRRESDFKKSRGGLGWGKEGVEEEMGDDDVHDQDDEEEDYNDNIDDDDDKKIKSWKITWSFPASFCLLRLFIW